MGTHAGSVMTLANSIIGVSVLAMPFCFKQCGIVLSIVMLMLSSVVSRLACHYLIKSAIMEKRRNFEMLAFRAFGATGKLTVELCVIGFLLGTCVAFFVVVGDLGPTIMAPIFGLHHPSALRPSVLIALGVFVVLPLGLLRNVDSLSALSAASIAFYLCLVFKVVGEATSNFLSWDWVDKVYYWRPSGALRCVPIFSMALSCQTQLFEIFDSLPNTPIDRMNAVVRSAINMTTFFYIAVGFFGYIAFCNQPFSGNLMLSFSPTMTSDIIKLGFVLSVAVSFPLVIFPCRASIYSLLFSKGHHEVGGGHIPETKFQCITLVIITISLVTGLLSPNIELVLGLVGSTIGVFICLVFPALIFISLSSRNTNERLLAKLLVGTGLVIMVLGTYTNLSITTQPPAADLLIQDTIQEKHETEHKLEVIMGEERAQDTENAKVGVGLVEMEKSPPIGETGEKKEISKERVKADKLERLKEKRRQEPPIPLAPIVPSRKETDMASTERPREKTDKSAEKRELGEVKKEEEKKGKADELLERLEKHEEVHKKLVSEGKEILDELRKNASSATEEKDELVKKMAEGVPLPVVVRGRRDKRDSECQHKQESVTTPGQPQPSKAHEVSHRPSRDHVASHQPSRDHEASRLPSRDHEASHRPSRDHEASHQLSRDLKALRPQPQN